jgi:hypothetical protein
MVILALAVPLTTAALTVLDASTAPRAAADSIQPTGSCLPPSTEAVAWLAVDISPRDQTVAREGNAPDGSIASTPYEYGVQVAAPGPLADDRNAFLPAPPDIHMVVLTEPAHASSFSWNADGSFSWSPSFSYTGGDSFTYAVTQAGICFGTATVTIPPASIDRVADDSYTVFENTPFDTSDGGGLVCDLHSAPSEPGLWPACGVLANDEASSVTDIINNLQQDFTNVPTTIRTPHGILSMLTDGNFTYIPDPGFIGDDSFQYATGSDNMCPSFSHIICDVAANGYPGMATVTLHVEARPPSVTQNNVAQLSANENTVLPSGFTAPVWDKSAVESGPDSTEIVSINGATLGAPSVRTDHGTLALTWADREPETATVNPFTVQLVACNPAIDGPTCVPSVITSMSYTPDSEYVGPDRFTYVTFNDQYPGSAPQGSTFVPLGTTDNITVNQVQTAPEEQEFQTVTVNNHQSYTFDLHDGVVDPDGLAAIDQATFIPDSSGAVPPTGTLVSNGNGSYTFTATSAGGTGGYLSYIFDIPVSGFPDVGTSITFAVATDAAVNQSYSVAENQTLTLTAPGVLANNDPPPVGAATVSLQTTTQNGTLALNADGSFSYKPNTNFHGTDTFTYLNNGYVGTVTITVNHVLQPPDVTLNVPECTDILSCEFSDPDNRSNLVEGTPALLRGFITDPEFSPGTLTINWGDSTTTTLNYPCSGQSGCPFSTTPTYNDACGPAPCPGGPLYFTFDHFYTMVPGGPPTTYQISVTAGAADGKSSLLAATTATASDADPTVSIAAGCARTGCLSGSELSQLPGGQIVVEGQVTDPGTDGNGDLAVDWGDGSGPVTVSGAMNCNGTGVCPSQSVQNSPACANQLIPSPGCGSFTFDHQYPTPGDGTSQTYTVTVTATMTLTTDPSEAASGSAMAHVTVFGRQPQAISFSPPGSATVGETPLALSATGGGSGNGVTFSLDPASGPGVCSLSGSTLSFDHVGSCVVDASQTGNTTYTAAPTVARTITVVGEADTITGFSLPATGLVGDPPIGLTAAGGGSSNPVTFGLDPASTPGACAVTGESLSLTGAGTCVVDADQKGDTMFADATQASASIAVSRRIDAITNFSLPSTGLVSDPPIVLGATGGGSSNPVTFSLDPASTPGACAMTGDFLSLTGAGTCVVDANQKGDATYLDAATASASILVSRRVDTITNFTLPAVGSVGGIVPLSATGGGSSHPVTFSVDPSSTPSTCSVSGDSLSLTGPGTCVVDAQQMGDTTYLDAATVKQSMLVLRIQTITFTPPSTVVIGGAYVLAATSTSGMAVKFSIDTSSTPGVCSLTNNTVSITNVGTCVIDANQAGGGAWAAAPQVQRSTTAVYGFGGYLSPLTKSTLNRKAGNIPVQFQLTNAAGRPIASLLASQLAAAGSVQVTLSGPGITPVTASCAWAGTVFQCNIKTPGAIRTGSANPYTLLVSESVGGVLVPAQQVGTATNPETIFFS